MAQERPDDHHKKSGKNKNKDRGERANKRNFNDPVSVDEAKEMGLNFRESQPKFKNDKKREDRDHRKVSDHTQQRNLREIIDEENANEENYADNKEKSYQIRKGGKASRGGFQD